MVEGFRWNLPAFNNNNIELIHSDSATVALQALYMHKDKAQGRVSKCHALAKKLIQVFGTVPSTGHNWGIEIKQDRKAWL